MRFAWMIILGSFLNVGQLVAQQNSDPINPDRILDPNIHTVLIHPAGNPLAAPIISLNYGGTLQISFDDFKASYQDYAYRIELVDTNWQSIGLSEFEYVKGFNQNKITIDSSATLPSPTAGSDSGNITIPAQAAQTSYYNNGAASGGNTTVVYNSGTNTYYMQWSQQVWFTPTITGYYEFTTWFPKNDALGSSGSGGGGGGNQGSGTSKTFSGGSGAPGVVIFYFQYPT